MQNKISDIELINKFVSDNDHISFSEIINRYSDKVHNLAMRITRNQEDTEDRADDAGGQR